jgi:phage tail-like protein
MAATARDQALSYPLAAWSFRVTRDADTMRFAKVSGLQHERRTLTYRDGWSFRQGESLILYDLDSWITLTLEQGTVAGSHELMDWLEGGALSALQISLCDASGKEAVTWKIARALPVKLSASAWDAASNAVAIDTLELKASGISIEHRTAPEQTP